jgi:diguanylate cyclase (GGDEF)-like protein
LKHLFYLPALTEIKPGVVHTERVVSTESKPLFSAPRMLVLLAAACILLAASVHLLNERSITMITRASAQSSAEDLASKLALNVTDIDQILKGVAPQTKSREYMAIVGEMGGIAQYAVLSPEGKTIHESPPDLLVLGGRTEITTDVIEEFKNSIEPVIVEVAPQNEIQKGTTLFEAIVPLVKDGKVLGAVATVVDLTSLDDRLRRQLTWTNLLIVGLSFLGFAIPAYSAYQRTHQKLSADEKIAYLAQFDVLTNLLNRKAFEQRLPDVLLNAGQANNKAAIHFIDLDFFKAINDNFGHAFGDELLRQFSKRVLENMKPGDLASRFGGDEFVVAQTGFSTIEELALATKDLYRKLVMPMQILGRDIVPSISMGTAMFPDNGVDTSILLHSADVALYVVKGQGRNGHRFFEPSHNHARLRRTDLEFLVRKNVTGRNFELHYQPIYALATQRLTGFEALLRMKDTHGKFVSPAEFIPVAEDLGLIDDIGNWVLHEACSFAATWPKDVKISVNLSSVQFRKKTVCPNVLEALKSSSLDPSQLIIELTESVLMSDVEDIKSQVRTLNSYGVELAMDDFGTGYSSLSYILQLQFNRLKIDRSFVSQLETGDDAALKIVETIISLGHTMKMSVTAEGVETELQVALLHHLGCDYVQGYYFSRPVPATDVAALMLNAFATNDASEEVQSLEFDLPQVDEQDARVA